MTDNSCPCTEGEDHPCVCINPILAERFKTYNIHSPICNCIRDKVINLKKELEEEQRLNGMGAERELALMAKLDTANKLADALADALHYCNTYFVGGIPDRAKSALLEHAKARGKDNE